MREIKYKAPASSVIRSKNKDTQRIISRNEITLYNHSESKYIDEDLKLSDDINKAKIFTFEEAIAYYKANNEQKIYIHFIKNY